MQFRNAQSLGDGRFDCEIEHPVHGWIPYTLDPADTDKTVDNVSLRAAIGTDFRAYVAPDPEEALAQARAAMVISPLQGILTLGEKEWGKVLTYRETATWQERIVIDNAADWVRTSQNIAFFGYLLDYTPEEMDALFIAAAQVTA